MNILQKILAFGTNVLLGQPASIEYDIPTIKKSEQVTFFGRTWTFTEEVDGDKLRVTATPNAA